MASSPRRPLGVRACSPRSPATAPCACAWRRRPVGRWRGTGACASASSATPSERAMRLASDASPAATDGNATFPAPAGVVPSSTAPHPERAVDVLFGAFPGRPARLRRVVVRVDQPRNKSRTLRGVAVGRTPRTTSRSNPAVSPAGERNAQSHAGLHVALEVDQPPCALSERRRRAGFAILGSGPT